MRDRQASITSSVGFRARLLRSEQLRAWLLGGVWGVALVAAVVRNRVGGAMMSVRPLFVLTCVVLGVAIVFQGVVIRECRRYLATGALAPSWKWKLSAVVDVGVPVLALAVLHVYSPKGSAVALSAPAMLGIPLVTLLSVLRLKPVVSLLTGVGGAAAHTVLVAHAVRRGGLEAGMVPMYFTYSLFLAVGGVAGWIVAREMRRNVEEAVAEAEAAERSARAQAEMEHDLDVARDIQRGLMPDGGAQVEGYDIAGMARPAQQTGGDYYDWQKLPDGRFLVVLADVTGHGIGPALVMAVCRAYARASAPSAPDPSKLLEQVNRLIHDDLSRTGRFITMVIAIVSPDGTLDLVSAGHGPTLLHRAGQKEPAVFGGDGIPLGIDAAETYGPHATIRMQPGDVLLLATDGFMEWMRSGGSEQFGIARMQKALARSAGGTAASVLAALDADVQEFAKGEAQADDTTAVVIKRTGATPRA